jgi:hypothetical protein
MNPLAQNNPYLPRSLTKLNVFFITLEMLNGRLQNYFTKPKKKV